MATKKTEEKCRHCNGTGEKSHTFGGSMECGTCKGRGSLLVDENGNRSIDYSKPSKWRPR
ncbi:MAG: hypothetical protein LBK50_03850 [Candidatus Nomurabacteria bacterium]|nr:hypothetical protein [Candidatus Nomurabacteria bacterium]